MTRWKDYGILSALGLWEMEGQIVHRRFRQQLMKREANQAVAGCMFRQESMLSGRLRCVLMCGFMGRQAGAFETVAEVF